MNNLLTHTSHPWYAIRTRSNFERVVAAHLLGRNYHPFLPLLSATVSRAPRPLFPGYVFCRFPLVNRLPILTAPGVHSILGFGSQPIAIPDEEIEAVQRVVLSGLAPQPVAFLRTGQRVKITSGSLHGLTGIVLRDMQKRSGLSGWKLVVSVHLLQRSVAVEIDPAIAELLPPEASDVLN